ncbi:hypothetical protein OZN48_13310 [Chryseobacterium indologenes]|uniref:hypothetical protein n=1 Tax=Chryseobacterium indologenes TaxID=253 RepID=UPI002D7E9CA4|nr:hypothetical protein [Chryseobacterium indologenes]MEB4761452.1 hypothetical protein [Chryseobacterium indologenes]
METPNHNFDTINNHNLYTISWSGIEDIEVDNENYFNDIENFLREEFERNALRQNFTNKYTIKI